MDMLATLLPHYVSEILTGCLTVLHFVSTNLVEGNPTFLVILLKDPMQCWFFKHLSL